MDTCMHKLACVFALEALGAPPEADEFMAELCRPGGTATPDCRFPCPEAVVDGT